MTPEGICSRELRCRFDDCYFVIKVNRNKNESVTKQLIYSCARPRRGSLGKAGQWRSPCTPTLALPCQEPQPHCLCPFPGGTALYLPHHPQNTPVGNGGAGAHCRVGEEGWWIKFFEVAQIRCEFLAPRTGFEGAQVDRVRMMSRAPLPPRSVLLCPRAACPGSAAP